MSRCKKLYNVLMEGTTSRSKYNWIKKEDVVKELIVTEAASSKVLTTDDVLNVINKIPEDKLKTTSIYARRTDGNMYPILSQCKDGLLVGGSKENDMNVDTNWIINLIKENFPKFPGNRVYLELDMFYWAQLRGKTVKYNRANNMIIIDFRVDRCD